MAMFDIFNRKAQQPVPERGANFYGGASGPTVSGGSDMDQGGLFDLMKANRTSELGDLNMFLEQALDPYAVAAGIDLSPYMEGVNIHPYDREQNVSAANTIISRIQADRPELLRKPGDANLPAWTPWTSFDDWNTRQGLRPGSQGSWTDMFKAPFEAAKDLSDEPGVLALLAAGGAGALLGGGVGGAAGATAGGAAGADTGLAGLIESGAVGTAGGAMEAAALGGLDYASFLGPAAATGTGGAAATAGGSALSRIINGTATADDWLSVAGTVGATGLGFYGAGEQADALEDIAAQSRADRKPFLDTSLSWLNDPEAYISGPGMASMDATLKRLSAERGNPIDNPTALALATQAGMRDWRDAVTGFANIGLSGEDSRNNLLAGAAGAEGDQLNALGYGLSEVTRPQGETLEQLLRRLAKSGTGVLA